MTFPDPKYSWMPKNYFKNTFSKDFENLRQAGIFSEEKKKS